MKRLSLGKLHFALSPSNEPALAVSPGETLVVETEDAFVGMIRKEGDWKDNTKMPYGNPASGPIYVEGAEKGDTLGVEILGIEPLRGQGATRIASAAALMGDPVARFLGFETPRYVRICPIRDGKVYWSSEVALPYEPMIGVMGTAPEVEAVSTGSAGPHGGNMDIREVCPGNRVYLPVQGKGGLLYVGDAHAAMGEGELCGTAVEMAAATTLRINLLKGRSVAWPRIESEDYIMAVGVGSTLGDSVGTAFVELMLWMQQDYGFEKWDAYNLCTQAARVSVGYYRQAAAAKFPKKYLRQSRR